MAKVADVHRWTGKPGYLGYLAWTPHHGLIIWGRGVGHWEDMSIHRAPSERPLPRKIWLCSIHLIRRKTDIPPLLFLNLFINQDREWKKVVCRQNNQSKSWPTFALPASSYSLEKEHSTMNFPSRSLQGGYTGLTCVRSTATCFHDLGHDEKLLIWICSLLENGAT